MIIPSVWLWGHVFKIDSTWEATDFMAVPVLLIPETAASLFQALVFTISDSKLIIVHAISRIDWVASTACSTFARVSQANLAVLGISNEVYLRAAPEVCRCVAWDIEFGKYSTLDIIEDLIQVCYVLSELRNVSLSLSGHIGAWIVTDNIDDIDELLNWCPPLFRLLEVEGSISSWHNIVVPPLL